MKRIPLEVLLRLDEKITNLPHNGKLRHSYVQEVAACYQVSQSTVYRQLQQLNMHPKERKTRKDRGCPKIIDEAALFHYCQLVAAMKIRSMNSKRHMLSTESCIRFLENDGVIVRERLIKAPQGLLKVSTVNRYLNDYWISPDDVLAEPTVNHFEGAYSNQCWQLDITPSELYRLASQHSDDPRRLFAWSVIDDRSGLACSRYYLAEGEDTMTALDFLYHAFSRVSESEPELHGIPDFIYTDNASFVRSKLFMRVMDKLGIQILTHLPRGKGGRKTASRAKGKIERHHRSVKTVVEPCYRFRLPHNLDEANACLMAGVTELAHRKHRSMPMTRYEAWLRYLPKTASLEICSPEQYALLLREPEDRSVKSDATIQINGIHYQLPAQFAGEEVTVLLSTDSDHIDIEHRGHEYGPFLPVEPPAVFGEYNHHKKSERELVADNVVELSKHITVNMPLHRQTGQQGTLNINTMLFPGRIKKYESPIEAKLALAQYIGKALSLLPEKQRRFIDALTRQTLEHDTLIAQLDEYMSLKLVTEKD